MKKNKGGCLIKNSSKAREKRQKTQSELKIWRILNENRTSGQTDLEQKFSFFDREAYMNTSEGENGNKIKNFNETEKTVGFQPQFS